ncbi:hypothetical protein H6F50_18890 [Coleofasciculus sp. FACHB-712]|uniref:hypothetical protein n=1 Tax=Coleofasciculus sp. FACHB-712 TaxID=2692789 RepID=UPI0016851DDD|nr:hypothetical protein [Coleofasciculus sp. FACHB-712]MBD1944395.1 hypothetical protein [Coleofasciculus sp. FACHB-712]
MAAKTPKVWSFTERATLEFWVEDPRRGERLEDIHLDSEQWFQWLNLPSSKSFKFEPVDQRTSDFIASKETKTDGDFWYAYKKVNGELYHCYIGLSKDLTLVRLREIGLQLLQTAKNDSPSSQQSYIQEVHLNLPGESQEVHHLKQEIQRLQDELTNSRLELEKNQSICTQQSAAKEVHLTELEQLRQENQRLQDELANSRLELEKNQSICTQQSAPKEVHLKILVESKELEQLKQENQRLQDELANSRQTYLIACQEHKEAIQQLRHQNQRLQTECDQMNEEIKQLYAKYGDLKLEKIIRHQDSERVKSRTTLPEQKVSLSNTAYSF